MPSCAVMKISFDRLERLRHRDRDAVGIHPIRLAVAVESQRRDDRNHALREQRLEQLRVHLLHLAGEQMIHALNDAQRMRDDDVGAGGAQVVGRKAFEDFVRQPVRGVSASCSVAASVMPAPSRLDGVKFSARPPAP